MPSIRVRAFAGMRPAVHDTLQERQQAKFASNALLNDGSLRPYMLPESAGDAQVKIRKLIRTHDMQGRCGTIHALTDCVSILPTTLPGCVGFDHYVRFYQDGTSDRWFPEGGSPSTTSNTTEAEDTRTEDEKEAALTAQLEDVVFEKLSIDLNGNTLTAPASSLPTIFDTDVVVAGAVTDLVLPAPTHAPIPSINADGGFTDGETPSSRFYAITWVDQFGYESPPAVSSTSVRVYDGADVQLNGFPTPPTNAAAYRIYRTEASFRQGDQAVQFNTSFQLVEEVEITVPGDAPGGYRDLLRTKDITMMTLMTEEECPPSAMCQVVVTEQGFYVGFKENELYVSERNNPMAWKQRYIFELPDKIKAITAHYDTVYIVTSGRPYRMQVQADDTENRVDIVPYQEIFPVDEEDTLVTTSFGAMYSSEKGLVALQSTGPARLIARGRINDTEWKRIKPDHAVWYDGKYIGFGRFQKLTFEFDVQTDVRGQLDPGDFVYHDIAAQCAVAGENGELYFASGTEVWKWNAGNPAAYRWVSHTFTLDGAVSFAAFKVVGDWGMPVRFKLFADGHLVYNTMVSNSKPKRLPRCGRHLRWHFELEGITTVSEVHIATSIKELMEP